MHDRAISRLLGALSVLASACLLGCAGGSHSGGVGASGRLVALSDGDLVTTAFHDGVLFSAGAEREADSLTVIALPLPEPESGAGAPVAQAAVSNCVLGPPRNLAITPDGSAALVLCTRGDAGAPPHAGKTMRDLARVSSLVLVDIAGAPAAAPTILAAMDLGPGAATVALHPDGDLAAVVLSANGVKEIMFVRVDPRHGLWKLSRMPLTDLPESDSVAPATVAFNPAGDAIALTVLGADQVLFYDLIREGAVIGIRRWGEPVPVANFPMVGEWSPDGRHFIVSSLAWGDAATHDIEKGEEGTVTAIRVAASREAGAQHTPVSSATVGVGPEGLALSPDGRAVVTGNMRLVTLPASDPRHTPGGSLTLLAFDPATGVLSGRTDLDCGVAPEGMTFDLGGETLFVTDFESGVVQQWAYTGGRRPALEYTRIRVGVARGVHSLAVAP